LKLESHLDQMSKNGENGDEFILAFRKMANGKLLGPILPQAVQPVAGMRWVKASERIPDKTGAYFCKDIKGNKKKVRFYTAGLQGRNSIFKTRPDSIIWLDERSPASQGREKADEGDVVTMDLADEYLAASKLWQQEYDACRKILSELVSLKMVKEAEGKTEEYQQRQPKAWEIAIEFLNKYQHYGE